MSNQSNIVKCVVNGEEMLLCIDDTSTDPSYWGNVELWRARTYASQEPETFKWIDDKFKAGDVIYDIGANIGQYSLYTAKRLRNDCRIFAFEPEALNYAKLNKNIVANQLSQVIAPYCLALTDKTRLDSLYVTRFVPGAAFHAFGAAINQGGVSFIPAHQQGMIGISLDDLVGPFALPFPSHMKIDVDGAECMVVRGGHKTLADSRLRSVMIEVYLKEGLAGFAEIKAAFLAGGFIFENEAAIEFKIGTCLNCIFKRTE